MSIPVTGLGDTFEIWRTNTNTTSANIGDIANLATANKTSVVAAVNELNDTAVAMAIALG